MVFTETKPRGPISAMNSTPGPVYLLPGLVGSTFHDPRSVHSKQPAYSFGLRHGKYKDEASPGPCYYPNTKISRTGKDGSPQYSLYSRRADLKGDLNPGKIVKIIDRFSLKTNMFYFLRSGSIQTRRKRTNEKCLSITTCLYIRYST